LRCVLAYYGWWLFVLVLQNSYYNQQVFSEVEINDVIGLESKGIGFDVCRAG
jgi:hypothetical protein